ncbi:MAG: hypothetical protein Q9180_000498 [Flavoplaca navasiana]
MAPTIPSEAGAPAPQSPFLPVPAPIAPTVRPWNPFGVWILDTRPTMSEPSASVNYKVLDKRSPEKMEHSEVIHEDEGQVDTIGTGSRIQQWHPFGVMIPHTNANSSKYPYDAPIKPKRPCSTSYKALDTRSEKRRKNSTMMVQKDEKESSSAASGPHWELPFDAENIYRRGSFDLFAQTIDLEPHQCLLPLDVQLENCNIPPLATEIGACILDKTDRRWTALFLIIQNGVWYCRFLNVIAKTRQQTRKDVCTHYGRLFRLWAVVVSRPPPNFEWSEEPSAPWRTPNLAPLAQKPRAPLTELDGNRRSIGTPIEGKGKDAPNTHNLCLQQGSSMQLPMESRLLSVSRQSNAQWQLPTIVPLTQEPHTPLKELDGNRLSIAAPTLSKSGNKSCGRNDEERSIVLNSGRSRANGVSAAAGDDPTRIEVQPRYFPVVVCPEITCTFCELSTTKVLLHIGKEHHILSYSYDITPTHQYCPYCWRVFLREDTSGIEDHCKQDHNVTFRCPICERSFLTMNKLLIHFELHDLGRLRDGPFKALSWYKNGPWEPACATCLLPFDTVSLQTHIQNTGHHPLPSISVICPRCLAVVLLRTWGRHWHDDCRGNEQRNPRSRTVSLKGVWKPMRKTVLAPAPPRNDKEPISALLQDVIRFLRYPGDGLDLSLDVAIFNSGFTTELLHVIYGENLKFAQRHAKTIYYESSSFVPQTAEPTSYTITSSNSMLRFLATTKIRLPQRLEAILNEVEKRNPTRALWYGDCEFAGELLICVAIVNHSGRVILDVRVDYGSTYEEMTTWTPVGVTPALYQACIARWYKPSSQFRNIPKMSISDIISTFEAAGISPHDFWIEWSITMCDRRRIMSALGSRGEELFPALKNSYSVIRDLRRDTFAYQCAMSLENVHELMFPGQQPVHHVARNDTLKLRAIILKLAELSRKR